MSSILEDTYLYKFHLLTNGINKLFDTELREHAEIGMSHFMILLTVRRHKIISGKDIAAFLDVSPAAISRQLESACRSGWLNIQSSGIDGRGKEISLTKAGEKQVKKGLRVLDLRVLPIFMGRDRKMALGSHIDILLRNMR